MNENEPIKITVTKEELLAEARKLAFENYQRHELNVRYERLGLLVEFISNLFNGPMK